MLEIVALIFLTRKIGTLAQRKGLKASTWKVYTILAWLAGEFAGAVIGLLIFGINNFFSAALVAIAGAFTGYVVLKSVLDKKPDDLEDEWIK
jgi:zinc transporter ZupT